MLLVGCWVRWPGDWSWSWLTAMLLERLLGVLLFTGARSVGRAVQWSPIKPESWSGWFPLFFADLLLSLVTLRLPDVPRKHPNRADRTVDLDCCSLFHIEVQVTLQLTVSQYVLASSTLVGLATRYFFLSECCCLKFAVLYLLGALSDERTDLQFAVQHSIVRVAQNPKPYFTVSFETPPTWRASYTPGHWVSSTSCWGIPNIDTTRSNSRIVAIVGYHSNSVYQAVTLIMVWVTCERFPWKAPTMSRWLTLINAVLNLIRFLYCNYLVLIRIFYHINNEMLFEMAASNKQRTNWF
jgi:hypothetical protein